MKRHLPHKVLRASIASLLVSAALICNPAVSRAAEITFSAPKTMTSDTGDTVVPGSTIFAYYWAPVGNSLSGVVFTALATPEIPSDLVSISGLDTVSTNLFGSTEEPYSSLSERYRKVGDSALHATVGATATITLNKLLPGHVYATQLWVNDARPGLGRELVVTSADGNSQTLQYSAAGVTGSPGQFTVGGFLADSATQSFTITGTAAGGNTAATQINALQLRDVTGVWSGAANGVWDSSSANFTSGRSFAQVRAQTGTLTFGATDGFGNAVVNYDITIQPGGVSATTINFRSSPTPYTFTNADGVGITGSTNISLNNGAETTFRGLNTYTGRTTLSAGALTIDTIANGGLPSGLGSSSNAPENVLFFNGSLRYTGPSASTDRNFQVATALNSVATFDVVNSATELTLTGNFVRQFGGMGSLAKWGLGTLVVGGEVGSLTINQGPVRLANGRAFGDLTIGYFDGNLDLNGYNATFRTITDYGSTSFERRITDLSTSGGLSTVYVRQVQSGFQTLVADGPTRKLALAISANMSGSESLRPRFNVGNTFSGGVTILPPVEPSISNPSGIASFIPAGGAAGQVTGESGNIVSGPYGRGPISIGLRPSDRVRFRIESGVNLVNDVVINANIGVDRTGIELASIGSVISGAILAKSADLLFSSKFSTEITLTGPISSGALRTGLRLSNISGGAVEVFLKNQSLVANSYSGDTHVDYYSTLSLLAPEQIPDGPGKGNVVLSGATLELNEVTETVNGLTGNGTLRGNGPSTLLVGANGSPVTTHSFSGSIDGHLNFVKVGKGTQSLWVDFSSFPPGQTIVQEGTLSLLVRHNRSILVKAGGTLSGSLGEFASVGPVTVEEGGALQAGDLGVGSLTLGNINAATFSGNGALKISKLAEYSTVAGIQGNINFSGHEMKVQVENLDGITLGQTYRVLSSSGTSTGTFQLAPLPSRAVGVLVPSANALGLQVTGLDFVKWTGAGVPGDVWNTTATNWKLNASNVPANYIDVGPDHVVFGDDPATTENIISINAADVRPYKVAFVNAEKNYTVEGPFGIHGLTGVTKSGTGIVTLNSPNGYYGTTTISQGVLRVGHPSALGYPEVGTTVAAGAALEMRGSVAVAEPLAISGTGISGSGVLRSVSGNNTLSGPMTVPAGPTRIQVDANTLTLLNTASIIGGAAALSVGGGGNVSIHGDVRLGTGSLTKDGEGTLVLDGVNSWTGGTTISGGTVQVGSGGDGGAIGSPVTNQGKLVFFLESALQSNPETTVQINPTTAIGGSGEVTYKSPTPLISTAAEYLLDDANSYTGGTTFLNARAQITHGQAFGSGPVSVSNGSALRIAGGISLANSFTINGVGSIQGNLMGALVLDDAALSGSVVMTGNSRIGLGLVGAISGTVSGPYDLEVFSDHQGRRLTLTGANTYTGATIVTRATLQLGNGGAAGSLASTAPIQLLTESVFSLDRSDAVTLPNVITGSGRVTKLGVGALTLPAVSDYTGTTTVTAGTLNLTGKLTGSFVAVQTGATLSGSGELSKQLTIADGGTFSPGASVGEFHANGGVVLAPASLLNFDLHGGNRTPGAGSNDLVIVTGNLTLDGTLNVAETVAGSFLSAGYGDSWTLFTYSETLTDNTLALGAMPVLAPTLEFSIDLATANEVRLTVVPEPATAAMLLAGIGTVVLARRRVNR